MGSKVRSIINNPILMEEWDWDQNNAIGLLPEALPEKSNKKAWWRCKVCHNEWFTTIKNRTEGTGCPLCADQKRAATRSKNLVAKAGSLHEQHPDITLEWDYERNPGLLPTQVTPMSNKIVWWKCSNNHSWENSIANRTKGQGCPYCSGRRVLVGFNDLKSQKPALANEWNYSKNVDLLPTGVTVGSGKKVWWLCPVCNHEWEATIGSRTAGRGCPACSGRALVVGVNDLATRFPELASEWDFDKNKPMIPTHIMPGSHQYAWWKCKSGHSWKAKINNRAFLNRGCPYCGGQETLVGINDLETFFPEIASEWDVEKNNGHTPSEYKSQSNIKVWWRCSNGHHYKAAIASRTIKQTGCPYCCNKQVLVGFNDLATTHPILAQEWDSEKNHELSPYDVTAGSDKSVWWKCASGHSWNARIYSRGKYNTGCPICFNTLQRSFPEAALFFYLSKCFAEIEPNAKFSWLPNMEIDIFIPEINVGIEYDGSAWHKNENKDKKKNNLCATNSVRLIRIREPRLPSIGGEEIQLTSFSRESLKEGIQQLFHLVGVTADIDLDRDEEDIRSLMSDTDTSRSLFENAPVWIKEWDEEKNGVLTPSQVTYASSRKIWWKCSKGHSWYAPVYSRQAGNGCPYCAHQKHGAILCVETGKTYQRYDDVAADLGISIASVSLVLNGKQKAAKGYHLKFLED